MIKDPKTGMEAFLYDRNGYIYQGTIYIESEYTIKLTDTEGNQHYAMKHRLFPFTEEGYVDAVSEFSDDLMFLKDKYEKLHETPFSVYVKEKEVGEMLELDRSCYYCGEESCDCDLL